MGEMPEPEQDPQATPEQQQPGTQVTVAGGSPGTLSPHQQPEEKQGGGQPPADD